MNRDLVEIYNKISDLKAKLPNVEVNLDFPEIVVVGAQVKTFINKKTAKIENKKTFSVVISTTFFMPIFSYDDFLRIYVRRNFVRQPFYAKNITPRNRYGKKIHFLCQNIFTPKLTYATFFMLPRI